MDISQIDDATKKLIKKLSIIELARIDFWWYCRATLPAFYKPDRLFLRDLCNTLQAFVENRIQRNPETKQWHIYAEHQPTLEVCNLIIVNMPPRHGKSLTVQKLSEWLLGINQENKIITISYNETLSGRFSKNVRNGISATTTKSDQIIFSDVFPGIFIKRGDSAAQMWSLEGQHFSYLGGSPTGTLTGAGCNIGIIDDIIKNKYEAYNQIILDNHYEFYTDTYLSRLEERNKQIFMMTRWSTSDLCGKVQHANPDAAYVYTKKAKDDITGEMLCSEILSAQTLESKISLGMSRNIVLANYQQKPIDDENRLYGKFQTYETLPGTREKRAARIDTADEGNDFLCAIIFDVYMGMAYVVDVLYTQLPMETTEPKLANMIITRQVNHALFESNNGGKQYCRAIEKLCRLQKWTMTVFDWFHETRNKEARILSNSTWVTSNIIMPANWQNLWPEFYEALLSHQRQGKNIHDDAADCITGVAEYFNDKDISRAKSRLAMLAS